MHEQRIKDLALRVFALVHKQRINAQFWRSSLTTSGFQIYEEHWVSAPCLNSWTSGTFCLMFGDWLALVRQSLLMKVSSMKLSYSDLRRWLGKHGPQIIADFSWAGCTQ